MTPVQHAAISAGIGGILFAIFHSWTATIACLIAGVFIDIDHHLDYVIAKGKFPLTYKELYQYGRHHKNGRLYLFLHSYELLVIFWFLIIFLHLDVIWIGIATGLTAHMICDQIANPMKPFSYFLTYRIKQGFKRSKIYQQEFYQRNCHEK